MRIDVLTLFPEVIQPYVRASIIGRAQDAGIVSIQAHQLRDYSNDSHKKVDDRPFGGGPGMVLMCQPVVDAVRAIESQDSQPALRVLLTPQGRKFDQAMASRFAKCERLVFICGHYEGFDERIVDTLQPVEVSLGDFVMTGGEIAALAMIDSVVRLLPGALGHEDAAANESFQNNRLDCPHYTRPRDFNGLSVPDVLLSGNHAEIDKWRNEQGMRRTRERRPDLLDGPSAANRSNAELKAAISQDLPLLLSSGGPDASATAQEPWHTPIRLPLQPPVERPRVRAHRRRPLRAARPQTERQSARSLAEMAAQIQDLLNLIRRRMGQE